MKQRNVGIHQQQGRFNVSPAIDGSALCSSVKLKDAHACEFILQLALNSDARYFKRTQ